MDLSLLFIKAAKTTSFAFWTTSLFPKPPQRIWRTYRMGLWNSPRPPVWARQSGRRRRLLITTEGRSIKTWPAGNSRDFAGITGGCRSGRQMRPPPISGAKRRKSPVKQWRCGVGAVGERLGCEKEKSKRQVWSFRQLLVAFTFCHGYVE